MNAITRISVLILMLAVKAQGNAQVTITVPNPSFENTGGSGGGGAPSSWSSPPNGVWQWYQCSGTADMMAGDGLWGVNKAPQHLDYYGMMIMPSWSSASNESIAADLSTPFIPFQTYDFSIQLANMKRSTSVCPENGNSYTNQYWEIELELYGTNSCGIDELLWESGSITNCDWQLYTGTVTPTAAYTQIKWKPKWVDIYALGLPAGWNRMYAVGADNMSDFVPSVALPVELSSFDVECNDDRPTLTWTTLSEQNNDYFEIEYAEDGMNFESVGTVGSIGNSTVLQSYQFNVDNRYNKGYFRLKQVDFDGAFEYSKIVMAHCNPNTTFVYLSGDDIVVSSDESINEIQVIDMMGKTIYNGVEYKISTGDFSQGMYIVNVSTKTGVRCFRIAK